MNRAQLQRLIRLNAAQDLKSLIGQGSPPRIRRPEKAQRVGKDREIVLIELDLQESLRVCTREDELSTPFSALRRRKIALEPCTHRHLSKKYSQSEDSDQA